MGDQKPEPPETLPRDLMLIRCVHLAIPVGKDLQC